MHFPKPRAVYIHVPFCVHRCGYCDFTVIAGRDDLGDAYLDALSTEMAGIKTRRDVDTIFVGGGTPTQLNPQQLERLVRLINEWFSLDEAGEFSVEANPDGLTPEKIAVLADFGTNRISLGMQSFDAGVLATLERAHNEHDILSAVEAIRTRIDNVSLDLIFGVPGQSVEVWKSTLAKAVALAPAHMSTYGLTFEKGTAFWSRREKGSMKAVDDQIEREMYAFAIDSLTAAGFDHYEISNHAQPERRCRHNQTYWNAQPYFGFGPGAARFIDGRRETNHRSVFTWLKRIESGRSPVEDAEDLSPDDRAREAIVLAFRQSAGINRQDFMDTTGFEFDDVVRGRLTQHIAAGLVEDNGSSIRLTREGRFFADTIIIDLL